MHSDALAATIFATLAGGCALAFLVMLVLDLRDSRRKPRERPRVPANRWPPA